MSNILLLMRYYEEEHLKIHSYKFDDQIKAFKNLGNVVYYISISREGYYLINTDGFRLKLANRVNVNNSIMNKILTHQFLYKSILKVYKIGLKFKIVYMRAMPSTHMLHRAIRKIKIISENIVVEIPSYPPSSEYKIEKSIIKKLVFRVNNLYEKKIAKSVDLYTLIGEKSDNFLGKPAINISNGIDVERVNISSFPTKIKGEINILLLAKMAKWHSYDRILKGLKDFVDNNNLISLTYKIKLWFVGPDTDGSLNEWKSLAINLGLSDYTVFIDALHGEELDTYFSYMNIGIGALGLFKKNAKITSELKIREYCARGLPFIYAANDESLEESLKFCKKVPNNNTNIDFRDIINLYELTYRDREKISNEMRRYAKDFMSWEASFTKIFKFLDDYRGEMK